VAFFDVFNGDADGICALVQLRLDDPRDAELVTGVKRDIGLLERVAAGAGDEVVVLDVALESNRSSLERILDRGASVFYVDHHFPGEIPRHARLQTIINTAPEVCTSLLVNGHLKGAYAAWAVTGAFGDNLAGSARTLAAQDGIAPDDLAVLEKLGTYINYNGYGPSIEDLHFPPWELYLRLRAHRSPLDFVSSDLETYQRLEHGYREDMGAAAAVRPLRESAAAAVFMLPDAAWARRVSGVFSNDLVNQHPDRAHAVITERSDDALLVSVRAPLNNRTGADEVCRQFETGGGRKAAAGINRLQRADLERFIETFSVFYINLHGG